MNLYFLLEDSKSFFLVLPKWLRFILPQFSQVDAFENFDNSNKKFMIHSGFGYPSVKNYFEQSLCTIVENNVPINYFIVCWDTDAKISNDIELDKSDFKRIFSKYPARCQLKLLVINRCFETWLLGNRRVYFSGCENETFLSFARFYNVGKSDPEEMKAPTENISNYHYRYFQTMLRNSYLQKNYSKGHPLAVSTEDYYGELCSRINETNDLNSFRAFIEFLKSVNIKA